MIDPQQQRLLELLEENNRILKGMQRRARWATAFGIVKLLVYVGLIYFAYVSVQPYVTQLQEVYRQTQGIQRQTQGADLGGLLEQARQYLKDQKQQ